MISHPKLKVKLNTIRDDHREDLLRWRNNPEIFQWCRQNDLISYENHKNWYQKISVSKEIKMYSIYNLAEELVGVCGLTDFDLINQRAEFSLYIGPEHQNQGYGRHALKLLCWHGFNAYPLRIIWGESFDGNPAVEMFKKVGFKEEGIRRDFYFREGKHINATLFSIKKDELEI